jgi:ParB family transcriptional regulator, chromosome partitioning protein
VAENIRLIPPTELYKNPENPRLIFRQEELEALEESIALQGILVPLTVYQDGSRFYLLDGERRWRCSLKLGLSKVPAIVQPKPDRMQNLMMMFAIHNARRDWDPLPTALKLEELEKEFRRRNSRRPTESELAGIASLSRGVIRRLKKLLNLPAPYRQELMQELEKPRSKQIITVDHVLEATKAGEALRKRGLVDEKEEDELRRAIIGKFRTKVIFNTVAPRKLVRLAQAVGREEVRSDVARRVVKKLTSQPAYSIEDAFAESVAQVDFEHSIEQLADRLIARLEEHLTRDYRPSDSLKASLRRLGGLIRKLR